MLIGLLVSTDALEVGALEGGEGGQGDRRLQEADETVEQTGDVHGERDDVVAVSSDPLAVGGGVHAQRQRLGDAVGAERLGDVGEELADLFPEETRRLSGLLGDALEDLTMRRLLEHGDEPEIVAALLLALLQDRQHVALDP
jgi:hypothetical protein